MSSALGYLEALVTGGPVAVVTRFSVEQLANIVQGANVEELYIDALFEAIAEDASVGNLSKLSLKGLVEDILRKNSYSLETLELHILQKEVALILLKDALANSESEAFSLSSRATAKFTEKLLADDQSDRLKKIMVYALLQIREYVNIHSREISNLRERLAHLENSALYVQQESAIYDFLDRSLDDNIRKIIEGLVPELSYLRFQYSNLKIPQLGKAPTLLVGRDEDLSRATTVLRNQKRLQIYGIPGVGKTTLARSIVANVKEEYPLGVISIDARGLSQDFSKGTSLRPHLEGLLAEIVKKFFVEQVSFSDPASMAKDILSLPDVLLYIDNLENIELLDYLFDEVQVSNCLITSRTRAHNIPHLEIGTLDRNYSVELYTRLRDQDLLEQDSFVNKICDVLGDLPLAISLVAKDAKLVSQGPQLVYERLIQAQSLIREVRFDSGTSLESSAYLAFMLSYEHLDTIQKSLFLALAFAAPSGVKCESLCWLAANSLGPVKDSACSPSNHRALERLRAGSLCSIDQFGDYSTHPLLREFALEAAREEQLINAFEEAQFKLLKRVEEVSINRDKPFFEGADSQFFKTHFDQLIWLLQNSDLEAKGGLDILLLYGLLDYLKQTSTLFRYPEFIQYLLSVAQQKPEPLMEAEVWLALGDMYKNLFSGEEQAAHCYERAAKVTDIPSDDSRGQSVKHRIDLFTMQQVFESHDKETATTLVMQKFMDESQQRIASVISLYENASPEHQKVLKKYDKGAENIRKALISKYNRLGQTEVADEDILQFEIDTKKLNAELSHGTQDTQEEANELTQLGALYVRKGSYGAAIHAYSKAEKLHKELGDLYNACISAIGMGQAYAAKAQNGKALACFIDALQHAANLGEVYWLGKALAFVAHSLRTQGLPEEALSIRLFLILRLQEEASDSYTAAKEITNSVTNNCIIVRVLEDGDEMLNKYFQNKVVYFGALSAEQRSKIANAFSSASTLAEFQSLIQ